MPTSDLALLAALAHCEPAFKSCVKLMTPRSFPSDTTYLYYYVKNKSTERLSDNKSIRNYVVRVLEKAKQLVPEAACETDEKKSKVVLQVCSK